MQVAEHVGQIVSAHCGASQPLHEGRSHALAFLIFQSRHIVLSSTFLMLYFLLLFLFFKYNYFTEISEEFTNRYKWKVKLLYVVIK